MYNRIKTIALTALAALCATPLQAQALPESWDETYDITTTLPADDDMWWQQFGDPVLTSLIERGRAANYDLAAAARRIEAARQGVRQAQAAYFPQLGLSAGWTRSRQSGLLAGSEGHASTVDYFDGTITASWEIDVFGKITRQVEQSKAAVELSRAERDAAMQSVSAEIASNYFRLRMYQAELQVAREHIASQDTITGITEARHEAGLASMLDVAQSRIVLYSTEATVPSLESMIEATISSIATLTGSYTADMHAELATPSAMPDPYRIVAAGVPLDLLRRRPDIRQAEAQIKSYATALGIANKQYLPSLSLTGSIGTQAHNAGDLFRNESFTYAVAPQLSWTIFDGMARKAASAQARLQMEAGIDSYNMTVLTAVNETNNAMQTYATALHTIDLNQKVVDESRLALELSVDGYTQGLTAFSNVVDAQMDLLQYQISLITARGNALVALVNLYKALGGAW